MSKDTIVIDKNKLNRRFVYHFFKRLMDIIASLIGLIILSPLFLILALIIKFGDGGSVFYSQYRIGKNGKKFKMYKFRSMRPDADKKLAELLKYNEVQGAMFKMKNDPRITPVGRFIRKYSLDELPQLWNVFIGSMSLVGPRPALQREVDEYSDYDKQRLLVMPGCAGLWQVSGRNNVGFDEMVALDLEYIQKAGFLYDLKIILLTIKVMIVPNNAY